MDRLNHDEHEVPGINYHVPWNADTNLDENSFDFAISQAALEHVSDPGKHLRLDGKMDSTWRLYLASDRL